MNYSVLSFCLPNDESVSSEWTFKVALVVIAIYWIKVVITQVYFFCQTLIEKYTTEFDLKYDMLITRLENLHSKMNKVYKSNEAQLVALEELQQMSNCLRSDLEILRSRLLTITSSGTTAGGISTVSGGPPPPPPPPPPFSLLTPAMKILPLTSSKTELSKKPPTGPPQFSISQADINKVLQKLKKTSSTSRLLTSGNNEKTRKTPPRRKLFGRTPGISRRRSITGMSPGGTLSRNRTPLSSISPPAHADIDINRNSHDLEK